MFKSNKTFTFCFPSSLHDRQQLHPILVLHGYGMSAKTMMKYTKSLQHEITTTRNLPFEFFALDGPFDCWSQAPPPPPHAKICEKLLSLPPTISRDGKLFCPPFKIPGPTMPANFKLDEKNSSSSSNGGGARAWFDFSSYHLHHDHHHRQQEKEKSSTNVDFDDDVSEFRKTFNQSYDYIIQHCIDREKQGLEPYRGIFSFSQGTAMALMIAARLQRHREGQQSGNDKNSKSSIQFQENNEKSVSCDVFPSCLKRLEFVLLNSGMLIKDVELRKEILQECVPIRIPSIHVFGRRDQIVKPELGRELMEVFSDQERVVLEHDGGHIIPTGEVAKVFGDFLEKNILKRM